MLPLWSFHSCQPDNIYSTVCTQQPSSPASPAVSFLLLQLDGNIFIFTTTDHRLSSSFGAIGLIKSLKLNIPPHYTLWYTSVKADANKINTFDIRVICDYDNVYNSKFNGKYLNLYHNLNRNIYIYLDLTNEKSALIEA